MLWVPLMEPAKVLLWEPSTELATVICSVQQMELATVLLWEPTRELAMVTL